VFEVAYTSEAQEQLKKLGATKTLKKQFKAVVKALKFLRDNPRHQSLNTHKFTSLTGPDGVEVFEAYAENKTPGAYRIFWCYHPPKLNTILVLSITSHP
jgi:hypothetical protein